MNQHFLHLSLFSTIWNIAFKVSHVRSGIRKVATKKMHFVLIFESSWHLRFFMATRDIDGAQIKPTSSRSSPSIPDNEFSIFLDNSRLVIARFLIARYNFSGNLVESGFRSFINTIKWRKKLFCLRASWSRNEMEQSRWKIEIKKAKAERKSWLIRDTRYH